MKVVLDTSCISAFIRVNKVNLLLEILTGHDVVITNQVSQELRLSKISELRQFSHVAVKVEQATSEIAEKYGLHIGEASVITYAKSNNALAVIDDKKARHAAETEGINFIGTATLLKLGVEKGKIKKSEIEKLLNDITLVGKLYLSPEIKNWILSK
ncbi:MAG: hypothetical protein V1722_02505 [Candidatus Micrarchaeota archaeon]